MASKYRARGSDPFSNPKVVFAGILFAVFLVQQYSLLSDPHTNKQAQSQSSLRDRIVHKDELSSTMQNTFQQNEFAAETLAHHHVSIVPSAVAEGDGTAEEVVKLGGYLPGALDSFDDWPGFPKGPMTLKQLEMCNVQRTFQLKGTLFCEKDPSCVACTQTFIKRNEPLLENYKNLIETSEVFESLVGQFTDKVVLLSVNSGQMPFLLNWYLSVKRNTDIDPCQVSLVIVTDKAAYDAVKAESCMKVFLADMPDIKTTYTQNVANRGAHWAINTITFAAVDTLVQRGLKVLMQDVDVVWLHDPFPMLDRYSTGMDMSCMFAQYLTALKGICNTGFVYTLPTLKSKVFWGTMRNLLAIKRTSDQELFGALIRHPAFFLLYYRTLPLHLFNKKGSSSAHFDKDATVVYHAVSVHKVDQMMKLGVWYYNVENVVKDSDGFWVYGDNVQGANEADVKALKKYHGEMDKRNTRKDNERKAAAAEAAEVAAANPN